ncbi:PorP/SprF family type IX secretion system membrane protein [Hymenobacter sp. BT770]|uniref:PorP/SprF family type IX secretion system membrane protein n=1 Tax=Hymenobacter sp. BT770 TaxID=2886942 RepID=UPI001D110BF4|nr:PorP/SprF family type IX secretion system membrane protein [Hymenobacter sp. BT770]MCC3153658.1 PorP/SprF family type IX secretion system membrane protein [Hymenobacter sp. BT770]MDO3415876.1 PorP/SprF family type IX secretion system membrane protein [Hymenobacter sp. BT770]
MKVTLLATLLLTAAAGTALAQQQPQFTHYGLNGMYLNPAYAGIKGQGEVSLIGRYQYLNYSGTFDGGGSPRTGLVTASLPILALNGGVGLAVYYDQVGQSKMTNAALSYSQHIKLGSGKLGVGIQGIYTYLSKGTYNAIDPEDINVPKDASDSKFDAGAGVWYESPKLYAGLSLNNLARSEYSFKSAGTKGTASKYLAENHAYFTAGYNIDATSSVVVTPMVLVKAVLPGKFSSTSKFDNAKNYSFEGGVRATIDDKYWAGVNYRHQESFSGLLGLSFAKDNAMRVGYAFDFIAFNQDARAFSSHEIMLSYRLPKPGLATRPAIRTPRYSF